MGRHSRNKEKAAIDYRHRWPTQQTLHESQESDEEESRKKPRSRRARALEAISIPLLWINKKIESLQDDIDSYVEAFESRKRRRPSAPPSFEDYEVRRSMPANAKPGKSTHPYDTSIRNAITTSVRDGKLSRPASLQMELSNTTRRQLPLASSQLRRDDITRSVPNLPQGRSTASTPQKRNKLNRTPDPMGEHKNKFRSILGLTRSRGKMSNISASEATSVSSARPSTETETKIEARQRQRWFSKKQEKGYNGQDGGRISDLAERAALGDEEKRDFLAARAKPRST